MSNMMKNNFDGIGAERIASIHEKIIYKNRGEKQ